MARPSVMGGVSTIGIVVAVLSILASLVTGGYGGGMYVLSAANRARVLHGAPPALPVSKPDQPVSTSIPLETETSPRGFGSVERKTIIDALRVKVPMSDEQAVQLDALLAEAGKDIFGGAISTEAVQNEVGDKFGSLQALAESESQPFYFRTSTGRAEVHDNRAVFYRGGGLQVTRTTAGRRLNGSGHPALLPQDVQGLIDLAQQSAGSQLTAAHIATLRRLLSDPQQQLVAMNKTESGYRAGLIGAFPLSAGYVMVQFAGGPLLLGPSGQVVLKNEPSSVPTVSGFACFLVMVEAGASIAAGLLLLVVMIRLKRRQPKTPRPLMIYVGAKLPLAVVAGLAFAWMLMSYAASAPPGSFAPGTGVAVAAGIGLVIAGLAYPLWLLSVLRRPAVRNYLRPPRD